MGGGNSKPTVVGQPEKPASVPPLPTAVASSSSLPMSTTPPKDTLLIEGVHCLYAPPPGEEPEFDVVFIPGLKAGGGEDHWRTTWSVRGAEGEGGTCWPRDWLREKFPRVRVLALDYAPASDEAVALMFWESAINCLNGMVTGNVGLGKRPFFIVAHSIGGLVAKEVLLRAHTRVYEEEVRKNCKGLAFYGVPHLGSSADLESLFGVLFRDGLGLLGASCHKRNVDFKPHEKEYPLYHFVETQQTKMGTKKVLVVPSQVAAHDASADIMAYIKADHFDVCRPFRRTDYNFAYLVDFITKQLQKEKISYHGEEKFVDMT